MRHAVMRHVALRLASGVTLAGSAHAAPDTMANPAAVFCGDRGGRIEIETGASGSQRGVCVFADGRRIDEWAYFRNNHRTTQH